MLRTLERAGHDTRGTAAIAEPSKATTRPEERDIERDDGLLAAAGPIMVAAYAVAFATAVLTFKGSGEALLAVAISIGFAVMFFAVPLLMMRVRARHDTRWRRPQSRDMSGKVDTFTGPIDRTEAVVHMVIVPLAVSFAFIGFAVIWILVRP